MVLERDASDDTVASYPHEGGGLYQSLLSMTRGGASYPAAPGLPHRRQSPRVLAVAGLDLLRR